MIKSLVLGAVSILNPSGGATFNEVVVEVPEGVSVLESEMPFNSVALFSTSEVLPEISFENESGEMEGWHQFEENGVADAHLLDLLFIGEKTNTLKIKSDRAVTLVAHFYNTEVFGENLVAFDPFDDDSFDDPITGLSKEMNLKPPKYISRAEWGADEELRVWKTTRKLKELFKKKWFETEIDDVPRIYRPKVVATTNKNGKPLYWPIAESPHVLKFAIHHTGEYVKEERNPKEIMRAIYYFHTVTRGWGDIGYNYVVDKQGNIYEGRAGGPKSVGAHTAFHNIGTVGVSLMGNFQREKPTEAQLKVLSLLLADHSRRFGVELTGSTNFLGKYTHNIAGHRDIAKKGHGTACPGKNLVEKLPWIRAESARYLAILKENDKRGVSMGKDFLKKSIAAQGIQKYKSFRRAKKEPEISLAKLVKKQVLSRGQKQTLEITVKNGTNFEWPKRSEIAVTNLPEGVLMTKFRAMERIKPGRTGIFRAKILVRSAPNGNYNLELSPKFLADKYFEDKIKKLALDFPLQVSGSSNFFMTKRKPTNLSASVISSNRKAMPRSVAQSFKRSKKVVTKSAIAKSEPSSGPIVKIKLKFFKEKYAEVKGNKVVEIFDGDKKIADLKAGERVRVIPGSKDRKNFVSVITTSKTWKLDSVYLKTNGVLTIKNYERGLGKTKYNRFRSQLSFYPERGEKLLVVNELPLEKYLLGLAEEPSTEPVEKRHAIHVLARSYAYVYSGTRRKFHTSLYDLEDDPATSQFYLGYDWEQYHSYQKTLLDETRGMVMTYGGKPVIGPYFTQSAGESSDKWSKQYPWTKKMKLPFDEGLEQRGHGVGLSGNSSRELAKKGWKYQDIIKYFFDDVGVKEVY
ncbi:MAG: N-acetylmuramoyl-L-alanine amidase [Candidatus Peregrinibacteria bacterium]|nr:N-acetylmuramoyl-L-alanine amidase [Candidatus Peregrinibacteria bacterium]